MKHPAGIIAVMALACPLLAAPLRAAAFAPGKSENEGPTYSPTHYVDPSHLSSSDSNPGTLSLPWKNAPGMPEWSGSHVPVKNNVIALKRGQVWRQSGTWAIGQSGESATEPIIYTAYGEGDLPKYTILEDFSTGWQPHSGNVYKRVITTGRVERLFLNQVGLGEAKAVTADASRNWVGQSQQVAVATSAQLPIPNPQSVGGPTIQVYDPQTDSPWYNTGITKYWCQIGDNPGTLYYYSSSGNPNGQNIEVLKTGVQYAVSVVNKSHVYLDRIAFHGGNVAVVNLSTNNTYAGTNVRFTNGRVGSARSQGIRIYTNSSEAFTQGQVKWNRVHSGNGPSTRPVPDDALYGYGLHPFPSENSGENDGITLFNSIQNWVVAQNDVSNFWHTQIGMHPQLLNKPAMSDNLIEHNDVHAENVNYAHGVAIGATSQATAQLLQNNTARYNYIYDTWVQNKHEGNNTRIYGNLIDGVWGSPRYPLTSNSWRGDAVDVSGYGGSSGGVFAYNTIVNAGGAALGLIGGSAGAIPTNLLVANNILSHSGFKRVIPTGGLPIAYIAFRDQNEAQSVVEVDNNVIYSPNTTLVYEHQGQTTRDTVATMESGEPTWNHNIGADPQFTDYAGGVLSVASSSPAWNRARDITSVLPESAGWTHIGCWQDSTTAFVTGQTLSPNSYNGFTGWKGMKFTVGATPITVTDVARWILSSNTQDHAVKLVDATGNTVASAVVEISGATPGQFNYATLASPVTLAAGAVYYLASEEASGGDQWWGSNTTLAHTTVATINNAVKSTDGATFTDDNTIADTSNVPVSFKYHVGEPFVTGQTLSPNSYNGFTGWKGMKITVGATPITVTEVARWILAGNTHDHTVKLVDATGTTVASAVVEISGATPGQLNYAPLPSPVTLAASAVYYLVSQETSGEDLWWGSNTTLAHTSVASINNAVRSTDSVTFVDDNTIADTSSVPVGFRYY